MLLKLIISKKGCCLLALCLSIAITNYIFYFHFVQKTEVIGVSLNFLENAELIHTTNALIQVHIKESLNSGIQQLFADHKRGKENETDHARVL